MGTVSLNGSLAEGDVFEITVKGKTFSYTATQNDTNLDQIAQKLAALINCRHHAGRDRDQRRRLAAAGRRQRRYAVHGRQLGQRPVAGTDRRASSPTPTATPSRSTADLLAGTQQLKKNSAADVVTALNSNDRNFIAVGLSLTNVSYKGLMSGIIGAVQQPTPRSSATAPS